MSLKYKCIMLETPNVKGLAELETEVTHLVNDEIARLRAENPSVEVLPQLMPVSKEVYDICLHVYTE